MAGRVSAVGAAAGWGSALPSVGGCGSAACRDADVGDGGHGDARHADAVRVWFWAAYLVATITPGISAVQLQRQLGVSRYETAWMMLHKLRRAMVAPERERLKGEVEVDECFLGGLEEGLQRRAGAGKEGDGRRRGRECAARARGGCV